MIDRDLVHKLADEAIAAKGAFLVELKISESDQIMLFVDHFDGIKLEDLTRISRYIQKPLDEDELEYTIEVSSPGMGQAFKVEKQYEKSIGRSVVVTTFDGQQQIGILKNLDADTISLSFTERVPKEKGKGKETVERIVKIDRKEIKEIKLEIRF